MRSGMNRNWGGIHVKTRRVGFRIYEMKFIRLPDPGEADTPAEEKECMKA